MTKSNPANSALATKLPLIGRRPSLRLLQLSQSLSALFLATLFAAGCGGSAAKTTVTTSPGSAAPASPEPQASNEITITSPSNGATVGSPFTIKASSTTCQSQEVTSIGYSLDDNNTSASLGGTALDAQATAATGSHVVHVKAWSSAGTACSADVTVNVTATAAATAAPSSAPLVPAGATTVNNIQNFAGWEGAHDQASGGSSSGAMSMASSPSLSGNARRFDTSFSGSGGHLYTEYFDSDVNAKNFFYDAWLYLTDSAGNISNIEMDMNQVLANGVTVIFGFQCDGYVGKWDYTTNKGTPETPDDQWVHSTAYCDARTWSRNQWHHVQVSYSRDDSGNVIYHSVYLDGVESKLEVTVPSAFTLGWAPALQTNFQVDGLGAGSNTVYLDKLSISRW
jgi:hypothetical protein